MVKRLVAALLLFVILLSALVPVLAAPDYEYDGQILKEIGVLKGIDDEGNLGLDRNFTRQDMVVMISRLYNKETEAKSNTGKNIFKDLTSTERIRFYVPYITWAREQGLIQGMEKDVFGFDEYTTVQEFQTVLLRALGYGEEAKNWNTVPEIAKSLGIMDDLNLVSSARLTRGQMSSMVLNTLRQNKKDSILFTLGELLGLDIPDMLKINEKLTIKNDSITLEGKATGTDRLKLYIRPTSSGITDGIRNIDVTMDSNGNFSMEVKNFQEGNYEYRFEGSNRNTQFKPFTIENLEFELTDISADNLKEIKLDFTRPVDVNFASFLSNYFTDAGSIKEVRFENNDRRVVLVLNGTMSQQIKYRVSANMKSVDGKSLDISNEEFTASDRNIPTVLEIVQLGNKGLKVVFSEPIKGASTNNFKIDGKSFSGTVDLKHNEAILNFHSTYKLSEGSHTLTVTGIVDFADYHAIIQDQRFTIINDITAPKILKASATLEEVIIEFDEDIDPSTALRYNFYYRVGNTKRYPDSVKFDGKKAYLSFKNNLLSMNEITIYVENVADYSGNKVKSDVSVKPIIDSSQPEVMNYNVSEDGKSITVYYSKNVYGTVRANYSIKDENNRTVYIRDVQGSDREFTILLSSVLPVGKNTLTIKGIQDTTPLKNMIKDFETTIDMKDIQKPEIINHSGFGNYVSIQFNKEMDISTVRDHSKYYLYFNDRQTIQLPYESLITLSNDNKTVSIVLPERILGKDVKIGQNLVSMTIIGLTDISGNNTKNLIEELKFDGSESGKAKAIDYYTNKPGRQGVLIDENTIKIKFNTPIIQADKNDFSLTGRSINYVEVDGSNELTLYLDDKDSTSIPDGSLSIRSDNAMVSYMQTGVEGGPIKLVDEVAPRVKYDTNYLTTYNYTIELPFTEDLEMDGSSLYERDLEIYRVADGKLLSTDDYSTTINSNDKSTLLITITNRSVSSYYSVRVVGESNSEPTYIRDTQGNFALESLSSYMTDRQISR